MPDVASPHSWARELAEKIRAQEAACIDETDERRSIDLAALVRKSLAGIPTGRRAAYLDELDTHFPPGRSEPASTSPPQEPMETETAAETIRRRLPELSGAERGEMLKQLLQGVFRESYTSSRLGRILLETPRKSAATPALDPERTLRILEVFSEAVLGLQRLVIELWREVDARKLVGAPVLASDAEFRALLARCLTGDPEVPASRIEQEIERQRRAIAAAMAMLGPFADTYAQAVLKSVAPESIAAKAAQESVSMFGSREAGYWKQYCRTWESLEHEQFEAIFFECLSRQLRALNRANP